MGAASWRMAPICGQRLDKDETTNATEGTRNLQGLRRIGWKCKDSRIRKWRWGSDQFPNTVELLASRRAPDSVVTHFDAAARQDMLEKTTDELHARQRHVTDLMSLVIAIAESNEASIDGFQTAVGDGDSEDVASEIVQDLFTAAGMLGVNDPVFLPE